MESGVGRNHQADTEPPRDRVDGLTPNLKTQDADQDYEGVGSAGDIFLTRF